MPPHHTRSPASSGSPAPLGSAGSSRGVRRHSLLSCVSLAMAGVSVLWLGYIRYRLGPGPPHWAALDPLGVVLYGTYVWPGAVSVAFAMAGLLQRWRRPTLSCWALALDAMAYVLLIPPMNFA